MFKYLLTIKISYLKLSYQFKNNNTHQINFHSDPESCGGRFDVRSPAEMSGLRRRAVGCRGTQLQMQRGVRVVVMRTKLHGRPQIQVETREKFEGKI